MSEENKDIEYWKNNATEDYAQTPISVLRYIGELEKLQDKVNVTLGSVSNSCDHFADNWYKSADNEIYCRCGEKM